MPRTNNDVVTITDGETGEIGEYTSLWTMTCNNRPYIVFAKTIELETNCPELFVFEFLPNGGPGQFLAEVEDEILATRLIAYAANKLGYTMIDIPVSGAVHLQANDGLEN